MSAKQPKAEQIQPGCQKINPYGDGRDKTSQVEAMFDNIAPAYDFMNRAMTMGIDKIWRRKAISMLAGSNPRRILDVATGTADLALELDRRLHPDSITGIDLSEEMLAIGRRKVAAAGAGDRITLEKADCLALPMGSDSFDCVTVAYGVRNFADLLAGYHEMHRVLRPGGMLCVIELSTPTGKLTAPLYRLYTRHIIPAIGKMISHDSRAYSYLPESIAAVPQRSEMTALMEQAGFSDCRYRSLTFGVCTIYTAIKA